MWGFILGEFKASRTYVKGGSGIVYEIDVVELNGKKYILVNGKRLNKNSLELELAKHIIISMDTNIPLLLVTNSKNIPKEIERKVKKLGGKIIHLDKKTKHQL